MNRRDFLKMGGACALAMLGGKRALADSGAKGNAYASETVEAIDFHAHAILPAYIDGLKKLGIDAAAEEGFPLPDWSAEAHLEFMAKAGIAYSVLSLPSPHIFHSDEKLAAEVARAINEEMAALCRRYPTKFGFVATLPLPSVDASLREIEYAYKRLGALGVKVASNSSGVYLGDGRLEPIFAELDKRSALVILHPSPAPQLPRDNVVTGGVMALFEYPADTTRAVVNLLANGVLERYPHLRLVVPHTGSFLPYMRERAQGMFKLLAAMKLMEPVDIDQSLGRLYFDLAGDPLPEALDMLLAIADKSRLVYGTDYPYVLAPLLWKKKRALDEELARRGWSKLIYSQNAAKLLKN